MITWPSNNPVFEATGGWDQNDVLEVQLYDVKVVRSLGPFKEGEQHSVVVINTDSMMVSSVDDEGELVKVLQIDLIETP